MHAIIPRHDDAVLPANHRVRLAGALEGLSYPSLCPACEAPASVPIEVARVFVTAEDLEETVWRYRIDRAEPLFCTACAVTHAQAVERPDAADHLRTAFVMGLAIPAGFLLYFAWLWRDSPAVAAMLAGVAALLMLLGWRRNAWKRVPPPTAITVAFDFGPDLSSAFVQRPRTFALANARYAAALAELNATRHAALAGPSARAAARGRLVVACGIVAAILLVGGVVTEGWR